MLGEDIEFLSLPFVKHVSCPVDRLKKFRYAEKLVTERIAAVKQKGVLLLVQRNCRRLAEPHCLGAVP